MATIKRRSPVKFEAEPKETDIRNNWSVALEYGDEGRGPWLVDLAHKVRWDLQDASLDEQRPCELAVPAAAGQSALAGNTLINRMNRTQASIWHLGASAPDMPEFAGYTDVSESTVFLALLGPDAFRIAEKLTDLDLADPAATAPCLFQGPFCHIPSQIVALEKNPDFSGGFLLACSRGYADSIVEAILAAGAEFGLRPAGENRFSHWIQGLQAQ